MTELVQSSETAGIFHDIIIARKPVFKNLVIIHFGFYLTTAPYASHKHNDF